MKKWNDIFDETPAGFHRRIEAALDDLEKRGAQKSGRRIPVLAIVLAAAMLAATAFAATQYFGGMVDWEGNYTRLTGDDIPATTPAPDAGHKDWDDYGTYIENVPAGEYWEIWHDGGGSGAYGLLGEEVGSVEELAAVMRDSQLGFIDIPDGWTVEWFEISYDARALEKVQYERETLENGAVLNKYRVDEPDCADIDGYSLELYDGSGSRISVYASIFIRDEYDEELTGSFQVEEGEEYALIESESFDRGIVITHKDGARTIRLQRDTVDGAATESYYMHVSGEIAAEKAITALFGD